MRALTWLLTTARGVVWAADRLRMTRRVGELSLPEFRGQSL